MLSDCEAIDQHPDCNSSTKKSARPHLQVEGQSGSFRAWPRNLMLCNPQRGEWTQSGTSNSSKCNWNYHPSSKTTSRWKFPPFVNHLVWGKPMHFYSTFRPRKVPQPSCSLGRLHWWICSFEASYLRSERTGD